MSKKKIYIAGPYTKGDVAINVKNAIDVADRLMDAGFLVYLPHLTHFWHLVSPHSYECWLELDIAFLRHCDALFRIEGESAGADKEEDIATKIGIPIFNDINLLIETAKTLGIIV